MYVPYETMSMCRFLTVLCLLDSTLASFGILVCLHLFLLRSGDKPETKLAEKEV